MSRRNVELSDQNWRWIKVMAIGTGTTIPAFLGTLIDQARRAHARAWNVGADEPLVPPKGKIE